MLYPVERRGHWFFSLLTYMHMVHQCGCFIMNAHTQRKKNINAALLEFYSLCILSGMGSWLLWWWYFLKPNICSLSAVNVHKKRNCRRHHEGKRDVKKILLCILWFIKEKINGTAFAAISFMSKILVGQEWTKIMKMLFEVVSQWCFKQKTTIIYLKILQLSVIYYEWKISSITDEFFT